ncbi:MAG TPA: hypothetical protein VM144_18350 [Aestuariivirga sp.]|nr:hypothetical protein [Aestuariivirga sp.]
MDWAIDWDLAIKRNSEALKGIIAALFAMLGDATVSRIPKPLHSAVLRVLRPAESAMRRLIVIAARGLVVKVAPSRPMPKGQMIGKGGGSRLPAFQLYDTRKDFPGLRQHRVKYAKHPPRIHVFPYDTLVPRPRLAVVLPPPPDGLVTAARLSRRLQALKSALEDLPHQARRMARWRVRREAAKAPKFTSPLRPGQPPGHRRKPSHEIDDVLTECHWLAWEVMRLKPDTS